MKRFFTIAALALIAGAPAFAGCSCGADIVGGNGDGPNLQSQIDASKLLPPGDLAGFDFSQGTNACGDSDPGCMTNGFGPPQKQFPLQSDPQPDPNESDQGVDRDNNGYIVLSATHANFDFVWIANMNDWNIGTVSKISSKQVKETARYMTVTCFSNQGGGRAACDGVNGCCSRDDNAGFNNRKNNMPSGPHQGIQLSLNHPSRTAVDFNGDMWVSNRAFGGQSSVSKIANDLTECVERNGTPGIQTSSDVDGNGVIDSDCNQNGVPDDVADVKAAPCGNGKAQEFYGFDDECILFTTNTNINNQWGRPLALGRGSVDFGPSDAWAGGFNNGLFFRIDGASGLTKAQAQVGPAPYGATVDGAGILWADEVSGPDLYYFDTQNPGNSSKTRNCTFGNGGAYGITLDRDQNVWLGGYPDGNAYRYTPDRSNGFASLGNGYWTKILNPGGVGNVGRGIAADSRTMADYWVWMGRHDNYIIRIPASKIPVPKGADVQVDGTNQAMGFLAIPVAGSAPAGAGVDTDQNIWGISSGGSVATRIKVDVNGNVTMPNLGGCGPGSACPGGAGDCCALQYIHQNGGANPDPYPYTYSDFTGFGLRNFTNPQGSYSYIQNGCGTQETHWVNVVWDADVPPNTTLTMRAHSGPTPVPDNSWGAYTGDYVMSPSDLKAMPGPVMPNPAPYMQVEFDLKSMDKSATPRLKSFYIDYECGNMIM